MISPQTDKVSVWMTVKISVWRIGSLSWFSSGPEMTTAALVGQLQVTTQTIERAVRKLRECGRLTRESGKAMLTAKTRRFGYARNAAWAR